MSLRWAVLSLFAIGWPAMAQDRAELTTPVKIYAGEKPIDIQRGHLAPFVADWAGDGVRHLLVGAPGEGKLRSYRNNGSDKEPRFGDCVLLREGESDGTVPSD